MIILKKLFKINFPYKIKKYKTMVDNKKIKEIKFYGKTEDYGYFSNFYSSPFKIEGKEWKTSEHYF